MTDPSGLVQLGATRSAALRASVLLAGGREVRFAGPIGDGVNWYAYVGGNPVVGVDPEGLGGRRHVLSSPFGFPQDGPRSPRSARHGKTGTATAGGQALQKRMAFAGRRHLLTNGSLRCGRDDRKGAATGGWGSDAWRTLLGVHRIRGRA